jgi:hypothetical protein
MEYECKIEKRKSIKIGFRCIHFTTILNLNTNTDIMFKHMRISDIPDIRIHIFILTCNMDGIRATYSPRLNACGPTRLGVSLVPGD